MLRKGSAANAAWVVSVFKIKGEVELNVLVYHGGCNDGFTAAWLFWLVYGDSVEYVPMTHGQQVDVEPFRGKNVVFVDFSLKRPEMDLIAEAAEWLVVLDHHESAEKELSGMEGVVFDMKKSGAMLAWEWLHINGFPMTERKGGSPQWLRNAATLVEYVQDRDLWAMALRNTDAVAAFMRSIPHEFIEWSIACTSINAKFDVVVSKGEAILNMWAIEIEKHLRGVIEVKVGDHVVPCVNATTLHSEIAGELCKGKPFGAVYFDTKDNRTWSLRSDQNGVNVAEIAALYGGGGHRHAAGFRSDKTFELEPVGDVGA